MYRDKTLVWQRSLGIAAEYKAKLQRRNLPKASQGAIGGWDKGTRETPLNNYPLCPASDSKAHGSPGGRRSTGQGAKQNAFYCSPGTYSVSADFPLTGTAMFSLSGICGLVVENSVFGLFTTTQRPLFFLSVEPSSQFVFRFKYGSLIPVVWCVSV